MRRVLLSVPHMGGREQFYIQQAFESNWLSTVGPNLTAFEQEFEEYVGLPALAVASGTAGIHLGLRALGVNPGDEVVVPTLTFVASVNPISYLGAQPVLVDSERESWNIDPEIIANVLWAKAQAGKLPRAVVVVHLFGQCADMDRILEVCGRFEVPVIEDAAEALGAWHTGTDTSAPEASLAGVDIDVFPSPPLEKRMAGTMGNVGVYSFNGNKIITTTGGGMMVSSDPDLLARCRLWAMQARDPGIAYEHSQMGYNYRMSNVLAGIGRGQLEVLDLRVQQRRANAFRYRDAFADLLGIEFMPQAPWGLHTNWLSCFLIDEAAFGCSRDELIVHLDAHGIESRPVWKPMHLQPLFSGAEYWGGAVAEDLFRRGICLPSSSSLTAEDQQRVIETVRSIAQSRAQKQRAVASGGGD